MASAKITLKVFNAEAVKAALRQYPESARARARATVDRHREIVRGLAHDLCAVDTSFMQGQTASELTLRGYGFRVGYRPNDFVGRINPYSGRLITDFYPKYVIPGTRRMAGQDNLTPALEADRPGFRADLANDLRPRRGGR